MPTLFITGANRGLGLEFTRQYAADGWNIIACCRNPAKAETLQALAAKNKSIHIEALDIADQKSIDALAEKLKDVAIDVLINNAGVASGQKAPYVAGQDDPRRNFGTVDADVWNEVLRINVVAPIMVTQSLIPHLRQGKERKIIMISSRMGSLREINGAKNMVYRTSKTALNMAMRCGALTLEAEGFTVISFHPGWVQTDMGGKIADITPEVSIVGMRKVIAGLTLKNTGQFLDYEGKVIPW